MLIWNEYIVYICIYIYIIMPFQNKLETGLTRSLLFDGAGQRNDIILDILELTPAGNQSVSIVFSNH